MSATSAPTESKETNGPWRVFSLLARWTLAVLFIYMGWSKAADPAGFLKLLRQYDMFDSSIALNTIAITLPWFEMFCGLLLLIGAAVRGAALILALMLIAFTTVVIHRALAIHQLQHLPLCAIKFDCGCGNGEVLICRKVAENAGLILLSLWTLAAGRNRASAKQPFLTNQS